MTMNLNIFPYYDDYDVTKGFHKILFKPGVAVQARELTQIQSLLQNQVTKFANHIFQDGSVVSDANHTVDFNVVYIKIEDLFNGNSIVFEDSLIGKTIVINSGDLANPDNRKFLIKTITQSTATDPKTIYATLVSGGSTGSSSKYLENDVQLDIYSTANPVIGTTIPDFSYITKSTEIASGNSILFSVDQGTFYTKNSFVFCPQQTIVVSKYTTQNYTGTITASTSSNSIVGVGTLFESELKIGDDIFTINNKLIGTVKTIIDDTHLTLKDYSNTLVIEQSSYTVPVSAVIGLKTVESIITSDDDETLLDPSFGSYNYAAPGADRYFISLQAVAVSYQQQSLQTEDFIDICHIKNGVVESDNRLPIYSNIADTFARRTYDESGNYIVNGLLPTVKKNPDDSLLTLNVASGKAYVKGYEIEKNGVSSIELTKPRTFASTTDYTIATQYGNYITVNSLKGNLPEINTSSSIKLYSVTNVIIGTARVVNAIPVSYGTYKLYLDDVFLQKEPFTSVVSIAELSNKFTATLTESKITDTANRLLVFPIPLGNIKNVSTVSYKSRKLYKSIPIYGGICSISSDSLTRDFVPSSGSENNINYVASLVTLTSGDNYTVNTILDLSNVTITVDANPDTNSSVTFDFNDSNFNGLVDVIASLNVTGQATRTKTLIPAVGEVISFLENSTTPQSLEFADIHKFNGAFDIAGKTYSGQYDSTVTYPSGTTVFKDGNLFDIAGTTLGSTPYTNIGSQFVVNDGQTDSYYGIGTVNRKSNFNSAINVLIVFDYYQHSGDGPLVVNNTIGTTYSNVGEFSDSVSFTTYKLRNCLDFRPIQQANSTSFDSFILPHDNVIIDVDYYLGRIDRLSLDKTGKYQIAQGIPARKPVSPALNPDAMDICSIAYEPYTDDETSLKLTLVKNKRYTMKDIGALEGRIENVEYYTSLSLLEKETSTKTFTDNNGTPLFNNGFLVDSFQGKNVADVTNPDMKSEIDYDKNELRPKFFVATARADLSVSGVGINENTITLPYTSTPLTGVSSYSTSVSVNPYNVITNTGSAKLTPDTDHWVKELLPVNDAETISKLVGSPDIVPVTVWNAWDPKTGSTLSTSAITSADSDFIDISTSKNKVVSGTTYNFTKNIIPVSRERVIKFNVNNMLPNTTLYYFFGFELQEDGFVTDETGSTFTTTNPTTDESGNATGYIIIPSGKEGSTFVITFCNSPAGKAYSSSYVSVNYFVDMSASFADVKPITVVTGDQLGESTVTELKIPKPTASYSINSSSYVVSEGENFTFTFNALNYDLKGDFTGSIVVNGGAATFDTKTVNGTSISSLSSFKFNVDSEGKAVVKLKVTDDGASQPARSVDFTVTVNNKSNRDATKYPEFGFGSTVTNSIKLLNPVKTQYSVTGPISVGVEDTINVTFESTNAEADIPISYKVYQQIGTNTEVDITSSFATSNPFNTSNSNPSHVLTRSVTADNVGGETVYKDTNGNYRFVFSDDKGNSKEFNTKINGVFDTKYYNLSNNAFSSNIKQGSTIAFTLDTNHYTTNDTTDTIPFVITANDVDISTISGFTVSPAISSFTGTSLTVSINVSNTTVLTTAKTLKLQLTEPNKGKGISSICYIDNNKESVTITANKAANSNIGDNTSILFTVTSNYGSASAGAKVSGIKVSNLSGVEYTLSTTSGVLNSSGVFTFTMTTAEYRTATTDKSFNVSLVYNLKDTLTSDTFNLTASTSPVLSASFRNSTNTSDIDLINPTGVGSSTKLLINHTSLPPAENLSITITPNPIPSVGYIFAGNTNTFSKSISVNDLTAASNLVDVAFTDSVPSNITLTAKVASVTRSNLVANDTLLLNNASRAFVITKDKSSIAASDTVNYTVKIANENASRTVSWSIKFEDSSDIGTYFSTISGTGTISVGGSLNIPITRNSAGYASSKTITLTVSDDSLTVPSLTNKEVSMTAVGNPNPIIKFYNAAGTEISSFLELPDSTLPNQVTAEIYSGDFTSGDLVSYTISVPSKSVDLYTGLTSTTPVYTISITDNKVDSNKKVTTTFFIKKNTSTLQSGNDIALTLTSAKLSGVVKTVSTSKTLKATTKSIVTDSLMIYRNTFKNETSFNILIGSNYDIFVDKTAVINTTTDKVYFVINPLAGNTTSLTASNFTITPNGGSASTVISSHITSNAALNAVIPSTGLLYDVTNYANNLVNFKVNAGSITPNDKVSITCYIIRANDNNYLASAPVTTTIAAAPVKAYKPTLAGSIYKGGSTTMEFSPENFASADSHTLTLPLHGISLTDVTVTVNGTAITSINSSGVISPTVSLTGNNKIIVKVTSKTDTIGQIESKIVNVADSTIKSNTFVDTNKGINIVADKNVNEAQYWEVNITPRNTDITYQVGVFDFSSGSTYNEITGTGGSHISYTDLNGNVLTADGTTHLVTFNSSNLSADNVAKFKYNIPVGFNSSAVNPKLCRIKFVGSDGSVAFFPINVSQNAALKKTFVITNDSPSANNAKKEGDIVTFTITTSNATVTDLYNFTLSTKNGRAFSYIDTSGGYTTTLSPAKSQTIYAKNLLTENTIKVRLDDNQIVDETTEILLTVFPKDTAYTTNGSVTTSTAFIVNSSASNQTIQFTDLNGKPILEVKDGEYFIVTGNNNIGSKSLSFPNTLVKYIENLDATTIPNNGTPGVVNYTKKSGETYKFKFLATGNGELYDVNYNGKAEFTLNGDLVKQSIIIKEGTVPVTINITQTNNEIYETDGSITFTIDTSLINSGSVIPFTLNSPNNGVTIIDITFTDANDNNKVLDTFNAAVV